MQKMVTLFILLSAVAFAQEEPPDVQPMQWPSTTEQVTYFFIGAGIVAPLLVAASAIVFGRKAAQSMGKD